MPVFNLEDGSTIEGTVTATWSSEAGAQIQVGPFRVPLADGSSVPDVGRGPVEVTTASSVRVRLRKSSITATHRADGTVRYMGPWGAIVQEDTP